MTDVSKSSVTILLTIKIYMRDKTCFLFFQDGRVLFMDPFVRGLLHVDFRANKDTVSN